MSSSSGINTFNTNYLLPGYSIQAGSWLRSKAYEGADWVQQRSKVFGILASRGLYPLSKTSEYIELPFRIVEDVALTAINCVGAIFNKGCRKNLQHCGARLLGDFANSARIAIVFSYQIPFIVFVAYHIFRFLAGSDLDNAKKQVDFHLIDFYRLKAMRMHGHENIRKVEKKVCIIGDMLKHKGWIAIQDEDPATQKGEPSTLLQIYKSLAETSSEEFDGWFEFYIDPYQSTSETEDPETEEDFNGVPVWNCPEELKKDTSSEARSLKRILELSDGVDASKLNKTQARVHLCHLLNIRVDKSDKFIMNKCFSIWRAVRKKGGLQGEGISQPLLTAAKYAGLEIRVDTSDKPEEECSSPQSQARDWECPKELKDNPSAATPDIKRILELAEGRDPSTMNKAQVELYLCDLLGIPKYSGIKTIGDWYQFRVLVLHVDSSKKYAQEAIDALRDAFLAFNHAVPKAAEACKAADQEEANLKSFWDLLAETLDDDLQKKD